ncbi:MAG TPA: ABC transporter permease [Thermoanaerobaculia bacterium]|nr:ABC transporter permease [Thermoanaerobaculia bacterium]
MNPIPRDVRIALRWLRRNPGFTLVATTTLALCIGATTVLFSVVSSVLLEPPAHVEDPGALVQIYTSDYSGPPYGASSFPDFEDFRAQAPALADAAAISPGTASLGSETEASRVVLSERVSGNYFDLLGVDAQLGRTFSPEEGRLDGGAAVAVIGDGLWTRAFGRDPGVLGRAIRVDGRPLTVVGVAPRGFKGSLPLVTVDLWLPVSTWAMYEPGLLDSRGNRGLLVSGRLADGATVEDAETQLAAVAARLHAEYPGAWTDVREEPRRVTVLAEREARIPPQLGSAPIGFLGLLFGVLGLVLLIACANIANLLLARGARQGREVAVRLSLGATRGRLVRQLITESLTLAIFGGIAGVAVAFVALRVLRGVALPVGVDLRLDVPLDGGALLFAVALSALTGLIFGLAPALRASRPALTSALKEGAEAAGRRFRALSLRNAIVVGQVAGSLVLLLVAGLFLRGLEQASRIDVGFEPDGVAMLRIDLEREGYAAEEARRFRQELATRLAAAPAVAAVAWSDNVPLAGGGQRRGVGIEGYEPQTGEDMEFDFATVSPGYFRALGVPLVAGRAFEESDREGAPRVVIVNQAFADRFWPGESALGKRMSYSGESAEVIGVARDGKLRSLTEEQRLAFFVPALQSPRPARTLVARAASGSAEALLPLLRGEVAALDARLPVTGVRTLRAAIAGSLLPQTVASWLLGSCGVLALLLAAMGLYGVLAYAVSSRVREIGIRMALGARAADVVRTVVQRGLALALVGVALGAVAAFAAGRLVQGLLLGASPLDPLAFGTTVAVLVAVAAAASWLPARRAARVEPASTLRSE